MAALTIIIKNALSTYYPVSEDAVTALSEVAELKTFARGVTIEHKDGHVAAEYIVVEGIVRACFVNSDGKDCTLNFFTTGNAITPIVVRSLNDIAFYGLQVLSKNASLLVFDKTAMREQMQIYQDLEQFGRNVIKQDAMQRIEREIILNATGKEKLTWFRRRFPNLENKVQHYHIASFLGLTPTSLSRIRAGGD